MHMNLDHMRREARLKEHKHICDMMRTVWYKNASMWHNICHACSGYPLPSQCYKLHNHYASSYGNDRKKVKVSFNIDSQAK